jgi:hypothetical protein
MKLAHLILAHANPVQLKRLVKQLAHPNADVFIHLDAKTDINAFTGLTDLPNTFFIKNRIKVNWCEYSTIQATLNAFEEILNNGIIYSHINLLSGADYPLKQASKIHDFLFANADKTFIHYDLIFSNWPQGQARISKYYFGDYGFPGRFQLTTLINKVLPDRKMPEILPAYGRSQWLTITPACAQYAINYIKENKRLQRFFRKTFAIDELFFQTILCNSPYRETLVNDNMRYVVLNDQYRPVTLTLTDADTLLSSGKFYARKFDINKDEAIFNHIDNIFLI